MGLREKKIQSSEKLCQHMISFIPPALSYEVQHLFSTFENVIIIFFYLLNFKPVVHVQKIATRCKKSWHLLLQLLVDSVLISSLILKILYLKRVRVNTTLNQTFKDLHQLFTNPRYSAHSYFGCLEIEFLVNH